MLSYYELKQRAERNGAGTLSPAVQAYLERRKGRGQGIMYGPEWKRETQPARASEPYRWVENASKGLRSLGPVHELHRKHDEINRIDHTGWFLDDVFQDETVHGAVFQLPARNGKPRYIPGVDDPNNKDCAVMDFHTVTDSLREAVRTADRMAELYAEDEREYREKDRARQRIEDIDEEVKDLRAGLLALVRELRANCDRLTGMDAVRAAIRARITEVRAECSKLAKERQRIEESGMVEV